MFFNDTLCTFIQALLVVGRALWIVGDCRKQFLSWEAHCPSEMSANRIKKKIAELTLEYKEKSAEVQVRDAGVCLV